jgi:hypothetical protein
LFWRVADELHYLWTLATFRILDGRSRAGPSRGDGLSSN